MPPSGQAHNGQAFQWGHSTIRSRCGGHTVGAGTRIRFLPGPV